MANGNGDKTDIHLSSIDRKLWDDVRERCDRLGLHHNTFVTAALRVYVHYQDTGVIAAPREK